MKLALTLSSLFAASLTLPGALSAQGSVGCQYPSVDAHPGSHPYGPVDPGDGQLDWIETVSNQPVDLRFGVAGLNHEQSLPIAGSYLTVALYSNTLAEVPLPLSACANLALPANSPSLLVNNSLELGVQVNNVGLNGYSDVFVQAGAIDVNDPGLELSLSDPARLRFRQGPTVDDPTSDKDFNCYYWGHYAWNAGDGVGTVEGNVYWPNDCGFDEGPTGVRPLVLIVHGDGHDYTDYHYLQRYLAFNGYISASIDGGTELTNVERAERMRTYLDFLRNHWNYKNRVQNNIALMGHSRGGEAVLTAARKFNEDWGLNHNINAVICLAPTDSDGNGGNEGLESLSGSNSDSLLVIYGSMDDDVTGYCTAGDDPECGSIPNGPQATGFSIYDRAGGEGSTDGFFLAGSAIDKAMVFIEGADHNRFREPCSNPQPFLAHKPIDCDAHHDLLQAYTLAFLSWQLENNDAYEGYFDGSFQPLAVYDHDVRVTQQYSPGAGRRVIDNFENGNGWWDASIGDVTKDLQVSVVAKGELYDQGNYTVPHDTSGLVLRWSTLPLLIEPWIRWSLPAGAPFAGDPWRDFSGFGALSLRVGQIDGSNYNTPGEATAFQVRLIDGQNNSSPKIWVDAFADLAYPHQSNVINGFNFAAQTAKSSMRSARIPLSYFSGVDLSDIRHVELVFGDDDNTQGEIVIDSLELLP